MPDTTLHIRVPQELKAELEREAKEQDRSVGYIARRRLQGVAIQTPAIIRDNGEVVVPSPGTIIALDPGEAMPKPCPHPKDKRTNVVGGKKCMVCGAIL